MGIALKIADQPRQADARVAEADYSSYTLRQLLKARYWFDAAHFPDRGESIEREIQNRCDHFKEPTKRKGFAPTGTSKRYRPYGFMLGVFFLVASSGPFLAVEFLDAINLVTDVNGDHALLSGVWAVLTLPFAVMVVMIGGIMDAERVVKWLNL